MNNHNRGFSTLELVMVVSIVGVTAAIAIPRVNSSLQRTKIERAASMLAADLNRVRENAKAYGLEQTVSFSGSTYTITTVTASGSKTKTVDLTKQPVESKVQIARTSGVTVVKFNAYGVPDQQFVIGICNNGTWRMVTVSAGSGEIAVRTTLPTNFAGDARNTGIGSGTAVTVAEAPTGTDTGTEETQETEGNLNLNLLGLNLNLNLGGKK